MRLQSIFGRNQAPKLPARPNQPADPQTKGITHDSLAINDPRSPLLLPIREGPDGTEGAASFQLRSVSFSANRLAVVFSRAASLPGPEYLESPELEIGQQHLEQRAS